MQKALLFKTLGENSGEEGCGAPCKFKRTDHRYLKMIPWKWVFSLGFPPSGTTLYKYPIFSHFFRRWVTHLIFSSREQKKLWIFSTFVNTDLVYSLVMHTSPPIKYHGFFEKIKLHNTTKLFFSVPDFVEH